MIKIVIFVPKLISMQRIYQVFSINDIATTKQKVTQWAQQFSAVVWLDSNQYPDTNHTYDAVLACEPESFISCAYNDAFRQLQNYINITNDWIFGYLSYDLKNDTEALSSSNFDGLNFPELYFFQPKKLIFIENKKLIFSYLKKESHHISSDFEAIKSITLTDPPHPQNINTKSRISRETYLSQVKKMQQHIALGDIYEANFCQEFYAENTQIEPLSTFWRLNAISEPPFACFLKINRHFLLSASPERYLQRKGNTVISQPIKGTAKRSQNPEKDEQLKTELKQNPKERSENVMIVDLVRNDLSHFATKGSVKVTELCKVYTFKQVHQLISTIEATVNENTSSVDLIRSTFPMGSMTGAPKVSAMKIIEQLEATKRGLYSGAVGYFAPNGDFDFNVVIRSILYNAERQYVSFSVGSAITAKSAAEREYDECLIKAKAMRKVLEN